MSDLLVIPLQFFRKTGLFTARLVLSASPENEIAGQHSWLSAAEREMAEGYAAIRQREFVAARVLAKKTLLQEYPHLSPQAVSLTPGVFGQPVLQGAPSGTGISISHKQNLTAILLYNETHPAAVDVECVRRENNSSIAAQLTAAENENPLHAQLPENVLSTGLWAAKEGLSKILRCGLTISFHLLETHKIIQAGQAHVEGEFVHFFQYRFSMYYTPYYVCALVYPRKSELAPLNDMLTNFLLQQKQITE